MKFGIFSTNSGDGPFEVAAESWAEDLDALVEAERLGFEEAWVAEHVGPQRNSTMCVADNLICMAAARTKKMRFGPAVRPLPLYHPYQIAMESAACDHLLQGRYMAGFGGAGQALRQFAERGFDVDPGQSRAMMHESVELILRCWSEPKPFDFDGQFWHGRGINVHPRPFQQPRMPVGFAVSETASSAELAGRYGFMPLTQYHQAASVLRDLAEAYVGAAEAAGTGMGRDDIRVCRLVHVTDSVEKARNELRPEFGPMIERQRVSLPWQFAHCLPPSGRMEDVSFDHLVDAGIYIVGDPDTVYQRIRDEYAQIGGYGWLLLVSKTYGTRRQRRRSLRLFMQEVAPRLADLGQSHGDLGQSHNRKGIGAHIIHA